MKKLWITALLSALFISYTLFVYGERREREAKIEDLPQNVQVFLSQNFTSESVVSVRIVKYGFYKIELTNGYEALFDREGKWREIDNDMKKALPQTITALLPQSTQKYLGDKYSHHTIYAIEQNRRGYEVKAEGTKTMKIYFDPKGNYINEEAD